MLTAPASSTTTTPVTPSQSFSVSCVFKNFSKRSKILKLPLGALEVSAMHAETKEWPR